MRPFLRGFAFAANGLVAVVRAERNFRFHLCVAAYVLVFSRFYSLSKGEWLALLLVIFGVLALELLNSALERVVDGLMPQQNRTAGLVKDMAAGAVLIFCIGAVVCGFVLFWDIAVFGRIVSYFAAHLWAVLLLAASLAFCIWFIFFAFKANKK